MTNRPLLRIRAKNFRSLRDVDVELQPLNVLVGPNEAGKSNFLDLIEFLGDSARLDLTEALQRRGGLERVRYRGVESPGPVTIHVAANVTRYSSVSAPDEYELTFSSRKLTSSQRTILTRSEEFQFKRTQGRGRRITVKGDQAQFIDTGPSSRNSRKLPLRKDSLALSTLQRLPPNQGGAEVDKFARLFTSFRVFNVDVEKARQPGRLVNATLEPDASNLASALSSLVKDDDRFTDLIEDARAMIPGFEGIEFEHLGGASPTFAVKVIERGLRDSTYLADASFGTVRLLSLLVLLYDPKPPSITCIEEIDHGLHPYVFDRLVERLREASSRTQLLIATHSPALVNRLEATELLVVERGADGATRIPAVPADSIRAKEVASEGTLGLGELWFSGTLGGVPR